MQTKRLLLASTALVLFTGVAEAQAGAYISVFGGANFFQDQSGRSVVVNGNTTTTLSVDTDTDTGFVLGGTIGYDFGSWLKGLRVEVETAYRRNDAGGDWAVTGGEGTTFAGILDANVSNFSVLGNLWYDVSLGSKAKFYLGGGAGWGRAQLEGMALDSVNTTTAAPFDDEESGFAYQFGAGFNYPVADDVAVGIGYRYFVGPDLPFDPIFSGINPARIDLENQNHSATVNLTIGIN